MLEEHVERRARAGALTSVLERVEQAYVSLADPFPSTICSWHPPPPTDPSLTNSSRSTIIFSTPHTSSNCVVG